MDALETLNPQTDSTLRLMREALNRGWWVFSYTPKDLFFDQGRVMAWGHEMAADLSPQGDPICVELNTLDVLWIRQEPPFDMVYLTTLYLLDLLTKPLVLNDPRGLMTSTEKLMTAHFHDWMPPTVITQQLSQALTFLDDHKEIIVKPLYEYGGRSIHKVSSAPELEALFTQMIQGRARPLPLMLQRFLPAVHEGDRRLFMIDGELVGAFRRMPTKDSHMCNLVLGAQAVPHSPDASDKALCQALSPFLKKNGLFFAGLDVIGDRLIEVNVTCPTGLAAFDDLYGIALEKNLWDKVLEEASR